MKQKIHKTLSLLLTTVLLLGLLTPVALAAGKPQTIQIRTAEDLADLAKQCTLDSWSQGKTVCLEGVEIGAEYEVVRDMGLELIQGYYYGRPVPADEFEKQFF